MVTFEFPRDRKDAKFVACALSANAEWLIMGDKDFSEAEKTIQTTILSVSVLHETGVIARRRTSAEAILG